MTRSDALGQQAMSLTLKGNACQIYGRPGGTSTGFIALRELGKAQNRVRHRLGIPEVYRRGIFQPSSGWTVAGQEYGGAGLGLSLVWEIADLHGVRLGRKVRRRGATIAVGLPAQQSTETQKPLLFVFAASLARPAAFPL